MANKKPKIKIICQGCGKEFEVYPYLAYSAKYCSVECVRLVISKTMKEYHEKNDKYITKTCSNVFCQKEFTLPPWKITQKFCCNKCRREASTLEYRERARLKIEKDNKKTIGKIWGL